MNKLLKFFKSLKYISLKNNYKNVIFGPEAKAYLKYFKKNYFYIEPTKETIINIRLIIPCLFLFFFYLIKNPLITIKYLRLSPRLFLLISFIKIKKIKKIITLVDYNEWPKILKKFLGDEIYLIGVQNSSKAYPLNRTLLAKDFDEYYYWNEFKDCEKKLLNSTKVLPLGSLKSHLVVNDKDLWNSIKKLPDSTIKSDKKNLVLISSFHSSFLMVYDKYLKNAPVQKYEQILNNLETKCLKNRFFGKIENSKEKELIPIRMFYYQSIEFFKMCVFLRKFIKDENINLYIIERNRIGTIMYDLEKKFFQKLYDKNFLTNLGMFEKIEYIVENRNHVFLTNISTLGRETLAMNRKSFFFSTLLHFYNSDFFDKDSNFFSLNKKYEDFKKLLIKLFETKSQDFSINKMNLKYTVSSCTLLKEHFKNFLISTDLELN